MSNTTQATLLMRLRQEDDVIAWSQFVDVYGPLVYRFGRKRGLQDADAADLTQEVMREVARCIGRFEYDPSVGRFRDWLYLVAQRRLSNWFRLANRQPNGSGDTNMLATLNAVEGADAEQELWEQEHRQQLFEWSCEQIQGEFETKTWEAFWRTTVENQKPNQVSEALGMKIGSVYVAKNRVLKRLREKVAMIEQSAELDF
ncbi:MAG: sigma-70 family RNA polymerase sigma factor [Planctomycetota bacterium]